MEWNKSWALWTAYRKIVREHFTTKRFIASKLLRPKTLQGWLFLLTSLQTTPWLPLSKHGRKETLVLASSLKACLLIYLLWFTLNNSTRNCAVQSPSLLAVNHGRLVKILKWRRCFCWFSPEDCSALEASCATLDCRCLFLQAVGA